MFEPKVEANLRAPRSLIAFIDQDGPLILKLFLQWAMQPMSHLVEVLKHMTDETPYYSNVLGNQL